MAAKKYYWLKLRRDFFKRHDTKIIEGMENGKDYLLFYMKLLVESIDHEGRLRFSETVPYNDKMLSIITDTNVDIVRSAVKVFSELGMMDQLDDGTLFMSQVDGMIGDETEWAKSKREYREKVKKIETEEGQKKTMSDKSKRLELEIELEIDKEREGEKQQRFKPPTVEEVDAYCRERLNSINSQRFVDYYDANGWYVGKHKMKDWKAAIRTWEGNQGDKRTSPTPSPPKKTLVCKHCGGVTFTQGFCDACKTDYYGE